jgi:pimeloyl-ACP methyl ester carboxylesterase
VSARRGEVTVSAVRSPLLEAGPGDDKEAVVFIHGNPGSVHDWARLVEAAGEHGRAIAIDMPGFGEADKPAGFPYTIEGYAVHLGGALSKLGVERTHLVLHDFGGPWGLLWAAENRQQLGSLTLVDTGILYGFHWHGLAKIWRTPGLGELFFATGTRSGMRLALKRGQPRPLPDEALELFYAASKDSGTRRAVLRLYRASPADAMESLAPRLDRLDVPALVVWGRHDPYLKVEHAEQQKRVFPGAEVVVLEQSGHWPMWDAPEEIEAAVVPFLSAQLG